MRLTPYTWRLLADIQLESGSWDDYPTFNPAMLSHYDPSLLPQQLKDQHWFWTGSTSRPSLNPMKRDRNNSPYRSRASRASEYPQTSIPYGTGRVYVHQWLFAQLYGIQVDRLQKHRCKHSLCVNPWHWRPAPTAKLLTPVEMIKDRERAFSCGNFDAAKTVLAPIPHQKIVEIDLNELRPVFDEFIGTGTMTQDRDPKEVWETLIAPEIDYDQFVSMVRHWAETDNWWEKYVNTHQF